MALLPIKHLPVALVAMCLLAAQATAQDSIADGLSERVLFVTSGGYWEEIDEADPSTEPETGDIAEETGAGNDDSGDTDAGDPSGTEASAALRGYYRLIAVRGVDNRSRVDLQQIALTPEGPQLAMSVGIEDINALGAYVTDIRPENSTGHSSGPGFAAFIYLKTDPAETEPQTWSLFVDEFGEIVVEQSSN